MKRPPILRLPNGQPRYGVVMHPPSTRGGVWTCTVRDRQTQRSVQGPFTDPRLCNQWCDRLSSGEDMAPQFEAIRQSAEQTQLRMEMVA